MRLAATPLASQTLIPEHGVASKVLPQWPAIARPEDERQSGMPFGGRNWQFHQFSDENSRSPRGFSSTVRPGIGPGRFVVTSTGSWSDLSQTSRESCL
ncbi:MAG: hypothetical protein JWP75_2715 [Frondihabitans sp.]|nr:hypothetical protein [Frondihabitans sp.]